MAVFDVSTANYHGAMNTLLAALGLFGVSKPLLDQFSKLTGATPETAPTSPGVQS